MAKITSAQLRANAIAAGKCLTNEIKKGMRVQLRNGWWGTMADNAKGNTRMVDVEGDFREIGSVYAHDIIIVKAQRDEDNSLMFPETMIFGCTMRVMHTPEQLALRKLVG